MNPLGQDTEPAFSDADWVALEQAGGVVLPSVSRESIESAFALWVRLRSIHSRSDAEWIANKSVRRHLTKVATLTGRLRRTLEETDQLSFACREVFTRDVLANEPSWGVTYGETVTLPRPPEYWEFLGYLKGLRDALKKVASDQVVRGRRVAQAAKDATALVECLSGPKGSSGQIHSAPVSAGVLVIGGGEEPVHKAAMHSIWWHLCIFGPLRFRSCSQKEPTILLHQLELATEKASGEIVGGGKRRNQIPFYRYVTINRLRDAYVWAGGSARLGYNGDDMTRSSNFIQFMCELNLIAQDKGQELARSEKGMAEATRKALRSKPTAS